MLEKHNTPNITPHVSGCLAWLFDELQLAEFGNGEDLLASRGRYLFVLNGIVDVSVSTRTRTRVCASAAHTASTSALTRPHVDIVTEKAQRINNSDFEVEIEGSSGGSGDRKSLELGSLAPRSANIELMDFRSNSKKPDKMLQGLAKLDCNDDWNSSNVRTNRSHNPRGARRKIAPAPENENLPESAAEEDMEDQVGSARLQRLVRAGRGYIVGVSFGLAHPASDMFFDRTCAVAEGPVACFALSYSALEAIEARDAGSAMWFYKLLALQVKKSLYPPIKYVARPSSPVS